MKNTNINNSAHSNSHPNITDNSDNTSPGNPSDNTTDNTTDHKTDRKNNVNITIKKNRDNATTGEDEYNVIVVITVSNVSLLKDSLLKISVKNIETCTITSAFQGYNQHQYLEHVSNISIF